MISNDQAIPASGPDATGSPILRLSSLTRTYPTRQGLVTALDGIDLTVARGEFVAVRGPSGCGKSTLLLAAGGMLRPSSGTVTVDGRDVYALGTADRALFRARNVGFVFQMFHLVPYLDILENVKLAAVPAGVASVEAARSAKALLERLGLGPRLHHRPADLSIGERQRAAMARALLNRPGLLLADEPTGNLDPDNEREVFAQLKAFQQGGGTVVLVTHGNTALGYADRVVEMKAGRIVTGGGT